MESNNHNNKFGYGIDYSIDPAITLSDLKKKVLLKYSNRDLYLMNLKNDLIKNGRTLFYPYCGLENYDVLKTLNYQNFILADSQFKEYHSEEFDGGRKRIIFADLEGMMVIEILLSLELNIHIDCFVGIKDEIYSDNYSFMLEMSIPLLRDKITYISSRKFRIGPFKKVDSYLRKLPFKCKFNIRTDFFVFFPDKELNDIYKIWGKDNDVFQMDTLSRKCKVTLTKGKRIYLINDSIWSFIEILDIAFIDYDNTFQQSIVNMNYNYIYDVHGKYETIDGLELDLINEKCGIQIICNTLNAKVIGFTHNWRIQEQVKLLLESNKITDIYIFCDLDHFNEFQHTRWDSDEDDDD